MNAYIKSDEYEYMIYDVVNVTFADGTVTIISKGKDGVNPMKYTTESLDGGTITII